MGKVKRNALHLRGTRMKSTVPVTNKADALKAAVLGEKAKVDLTKATWLDQPLVEELRILIKARAKIKKQEDDIESHKRDIISQIEVLMDTLGLDSALDPGIGSLTKYTGPWMLTGRVYHVPGPLGMDDSTTWQGQVRRYFGRGGTSFAGAGYSRGLAREEIRNSADFLTLGSDTVRGELDSALGRRLRLNLWGGSSRQERAANVVWQHTFGVGVDVVF